MVAGPPLLTIASLSGSPSHKCSMASFINETWRDRLAAWLPEDQVDSFQDLHALEIVGWKLAEKKAMGIKIGGA